MTKFCNKLKKTCFWPILAPLSQKIRLSRTTSNGILAPCQISGKTNDRIPRKHLDRRTERTMDRPYFIGPFQLLPGVQKKMHKEISFHNYQQIQTGKILVGAKQAVFEWNISIIYLVHVDFTDVINKMILIKIKRQSHCQKIWKNSRNPMFFL